MRIAAAGLLAFGTAACLTGCGGGDPATAPAAAQATASTANTGDPIARVVYEFLDAVRQGNTPVASQRLTPLALKATAEHDLLFSPPASPTARFEIGKVERIEQDKAVVESVWIDLDVDGKANREPIVWALRQTEGQWRISGMAAEMGPDRPPVIIDFENPASMVQSNPSQPAAPAAAAAVPSSGAQSESQVARDPFNSAPAR